MKAARHFRIHNERDVLRRFQGQTATLRPLVDEIEIEDPADPPPAIVLRYLEDDLLHAAAAAAAAAASAKKLSKLEIKYAAKRILEALDVLHCNGYVHTDIKPSNILVNYDGEVKDGLKDGNRFADVQVADLGSTVRADSGHARDGDAIGTPIFRSPEATLRLPWNTATDIWSFGATLLSMLFGDIHIFKPMVSMDHEDYEREILRRMHVFFGPYPLTYQEFASESALALLADVMESVPQTARKPFHMLRDKELTVEDKAFLLKIMKLDPRDRPTAGQLRRDEWFT